MGFFDKLFGGNAEQKTTATTTPTLPSWLQGPLQELITNARGASTQGVTPTEQNALNYILSNAGSYQGYLNQAAGSAANTLNKVSAGPSTADIQGGMNPYLDLILNRQRKEAQDTYYSGLSDLRDQQTAAGAFGGSRGAVAEQQLQNNYADNLDDIQSSAMFNAYETARNQFNTNNQMAMTGAANLANMGNAAQSNVLNTGNAMLGAGGYGRGVDQNNLTFLNSILGPAAELMRGSTSTQTTTQSDGSGWLSKIMGTVASVAGLAGGNPLAALGLGGGGGGVSPMPTFSSPQGNFSPSSAGNIYWNNYADGGLVGDMPDYIRNAPDMSWEEKLRAFDMERQQNRGQRQRMNYESDQDRIRSFLGKDDPSGDNLLNEVLDQVIPKKKPSVIETTKLKNSREMTPAQIAFTQSRNPGLSEVMAALDSMPAEEINALFQMDASKLGDSIPAFKCGGMVKKYYSGGPVEGLSAAEEEAYWDRLNPSPTRANPITLGGKNRTQLLGGGDQTYIDPKTLLQQAIDEERAATNAASKQTLLNLSNKAVSGVKNQLQKNADTIASKVDTKGMTRLEAALAKAAQTPRKMGAAMSDIALAPASLGIGLGEWLGEVPEENAVDPVTEQFGEVPMREVGEVTTPKGAVIPVEAPVTRKSKAESIPSTVNEVKAAVKAEEEAPSSGMNVPLIMAGIAMLTSKNDAFSAMGEGLAAYLSGKDAIERTKAEKAKLEQQARLAERAMQVDEGKLDVMRDQLHLDAAKIAQAAKSSGVTVDKVQDDITNVFKERLSTIAATLRAGDKIDMNALMEEQYNIAADTVYGFYSGQKPTSSVQLTPLDKLLAAAQQGKPTKE